MQKKLKALKKIRNNGAFRDLNPKTQHKIIHQIRCIEFQIRLEEAKQETLEVVSDGWDKFLPSDDEVNESQWDLYSTEEYGAHW